MPFDGVAFLWLKCPASHISYVGSDGEGRCITIWLTINYRLIILLYVYFPYLSTKESYKNDLNKCLCFIDSVISVNNGSDVVTIADMKFTYDNGNPKFAMFNISAQLYL